MFVPSWFQMRKPGSGEVVLQVKRFKGSHHDNKRTIKNSYDMIEPSQKRVTPNPGGFMLKELMTIKWSSSSTGPFRTCDNNQASSSQEEQKKELLVPDGSV